MSSCYPRDLDIRPATADDVDTIVALVRELALFEREPEAAVATREDFLRDGFGPSPLFHVLLARHLGDVAGFAFYFFKYSTWRGRPSLHLEDLFVRETHRKHGIASALMAELAAEALRAHCTRFEWQVLDWNQGAIDFYERLGAVVQREWLPVRVDGEALVALAAKAGSHRTSG
jgi:GNAT superfamily N-acetyltransferase